MTVVEVGERGQNFHLNVLLTVGQLESPFQWGKNKRSDVIYIHGRGVQRGKIIDIMLQKKLESALFFYANTIHG